MKLIFDVLHIAELPQCEVKATEALKETSSNYFCGVKKKSCPAVCTLNVGCRAEDVRKYEP